MSNFTEELMSQLQILHPRLTRTMTDFIEVPNPKTCLIPLLLCLCFFHSKAQLGGSQDFSWLALPASAQQVALGSYNVSSNCQDVSRQLDNPAFLSDSLNGWAQANYQSYFATANALTFAYAHALKVGQLGFAMRSLGYGDIDAYDITGQSQGTFQAKHTLLQTSYALQKGVYGFGISLKYAQSNIDIFRSSALFFDIGGLFIHPKKDLRVGFAIKNIGSRLSSFAGEQEFNPPFDVQFGISFKPEKMPLRLSITAHHLHDFDIAYEDPALLLQQDALGNPLEEPLSFADKLARHFSIGGEFVLGKVIRAQVGYNFLKRRELVLEDVGGTVGLSWGLAIKTAKWQFAFSRDAFFTGQGASSFSLAFHPASLVRKRRVIN